MTACSNSLGQRPLPVLLAKTAERFVCEFERRLTESDFCSLSLAHSANVLRFLRDEPRRASQLVELSGISKQAVSQQIGHLERNGYVALEPDPDDQRARIVTLTPKGRKAQSRVDELFTEVEQDWAAVIGQRDAASLRRILEKAQDRLGVRVDRGGALERAVLSR